jgi:hypothetical protein
MRWLFIVLLEPNHTRGASNHVISKQKPTRDLEHFIQKRIRVHHEGNHLVRTQIRSLRAPGPLNGAPESANYCPHLSSLRPLLWVALTHMAGFALEP